MGLGTLGWGHWDMGWGHRDIETRGHLVMGTSGCGDTGTRRGQGAGGVGGAAVPSWRCHPPPGQQQREESRAVTIVTIVTVVTVVTIVVTVARRAQHAVVQAAVAARAEAAG